MTWFESFEKRVREENAEKKVKELQKEYGEDLEAEE